MIWIEARLTAEQKAEIERTGHIAQPSDYSDEPHIITRRLLQDGRKHLILRAPLHLNCPVRLLHGTDDVDVPQSVALKLLAHMDCPDARLTLVKNAEHRFSEPDQLAMIGKALHGMTERIRS